jgi:N-acetylglucosamine-6-sulfatase
MRASSALALCAAATLISAGEGPPTAQGREAATERPNVVVVMTDDQEARSLKVMKSVRVALQKKGVTFVKSFVNFPLCCPSRATFLTGQYAHNHGVLSNRRPFGGYQKLDASNTLAVWLRAAGYNTALVGKYLNGYGGRGHVRIPPGWDEWVVALRPVYYYYRYVLNVNGRRVGFGARPKEYKTRVETSFAKRYIRASAKEAEPFFLWVAYNAPHRGGPRVPAGECSGGFPKAAPGDEGTFAAKPLPSPPSFNEGDVSDKPKKIRGLPRLSSDLQRKITRKYRCRLDSLLAVDDGVAKLVRTLRDTGELDNTYFIYTSDNGYLHGEHRVQGGKSVPYEEAIRVPLVIRGPGIPRGRTARGMVINADLAPTILAATGASPGLPLDGTSILPLATHPKRRSGRDLLIETRKFTAIRTRRHIYVEWANGDRELYDLRRDPYQLKSRHRSRRYAGLRAELAERLASLRDCVGQDCVNRLAAKPR